MSKSEKVKQYEEDFRDEHGYIFCEAEKCGVSNSFAFSTHHCHTKGEYPKHKEIDNPLNLKILCSEHHKMAHSNKEFNNKLKEDSYELFNT